MRIQRLSLELFGQFTDRNFDFGAAGDASDFHIIYGRNEAGKTTTMEGFLRLLYGFEHREPYDFLHQRKNLRVSGMLALDGATRHVTRLPTRSANLLDGTGAVLPEQALAAHLGGLSLEDYRHLLCLDDETIEKGGEDIANARGDIGRLLFSAAAGLPDLTTILTQARSEADTLYRKRASKTRVAELKRELDQTDAQIRAQDVSAAAFRRLKQAHGEAQAAEAAAREARDALHARKAQVEAQRRALPDLQTRDRLCAALVGLEDYPRCLDLDPETLVTLQTRQATAQAEVKRLDREIAEAEAQLAEIVLAPARLTLAGALDDLDDARSRHVAAQSDLPKRRRAWDAASEQMHRAARDLAAPEGTDPQALVLGAAGITALETARDALRTARSARDAEAAEVAGLQARVTEATEALESLRADAIAPSGVADLLARHDVDRLAPAVAAAQQARDAARDALAEALAALGQGSTVFATLPDCPVDAATAQALARQHVDATAQLAQARAERDGFLSEAEAQQAQHDALSARAGLVPDAQANAARDHRDALWREHRAALNAATADAFHAAMTQLDTLGDARLAAARELGQLREIARALVEAQTRAAQAEKRCEASAAALSDIEARVAGIAGALGLDSLTPAGLPDWVARHATAAKAAHRLDRLVLRDGATLERAARLLAALRPFIGLEDPDFEGALAAARDLAARERAQAARESTAEATRAQLERDLDRRRAKLASLDADLQMAQENWRTLVAECFAGALDPDVLEASLEPLRALREQDNLRVDAEHRITTMEADQQHFSDAMAGLAAQHGVTPAPDPLESFATLREIAQDAQDAQARHDQLATAIAGKTEARDATQRALDDIARQVQEIGRLFPASAPTATLDALRQTLGRAREAIAQRARITELENAILSDLGVADLDAARALLGDATLAALEAEAGGLEADIARAEQALSAATEARTHAARDLAAVTGDADIAALVQHKAALELQIEAALLDYLARDFGLRLADEAIRRYRDSHRGAMMEATERAFADLTHGAYTRLNSVQDGASEVLQVITAEGGAKQVGDLSKGTRFQLYLALRAAAYEQLVAQGVRLPFFCDDIFETFDEERTRAACQLMERIGQSGQAIYLTHHRHVVEIAQASCKRAPKVHHL